MKFGDEPIFVNLVSLHGSFNSHCEGWIDNEKKKNMKITEESCRERPHGKNCLLTLALKPFRP